VRSTANQLSHRHSLSTQRAEFGDWLPATGHRHSLTSGNPIDDLTTVVAEFPYRHIDHSANVSQVIHKCLAFVYSRTRLTDRLSLHRARTARADDAQLRIFLPIHLSIGPETVRLGPQAP
jgi:hypothetical protein